ncbi:MAG TPA: hypothetical protein VMS77_01540 [Conexivisphaerales archaeon]|nr:hypothetical protein [Conexivisphaerales archaeon]
MAQKAPGDADDSWKGFLRRHWTMLAFWVVGAVLAAIGGVLVFLWFVGDAQSTGMVPASLALWTMGHCVTFMLNLIFWELVYVGIPIGVASVAGWLWWKRIPDEERRKYRFFSGGSRSTSGGGGFFSLVVFIAFCFEVNADGKWNVPVSTWTLNYVVYSWLTALAWILVVIGIPLALGGIWWLSRRMKS